MRSMSYEEYHQALNNSHCPIFHGISVKQHVEGEGFDYPIHLFFLLTIETAIPAMTTMTADVLPLLIGQLYER